MPLNPKPTIYDFLNNLFDTNAEFSSSHNNEFFERFSQEQKPYLTILKCSDSRVQMESFDKTPQNGVFAIRNIGNQVLTSEGSIDFGVEVLKTPFLMIVGHSGCGAVECVVNKVKTEMPAINKELDTLEIKSSNMEQAIIENIDYQVSIALSKYADKVKDGELTILGAIYDFQNQFGFGHGKVVLTSINGEKKPQIIQEKYKKYVNNMQFIKVNT